MKEFKLYIKTENSAFEFPEVEVARILRLVAEKLENGYDGGPLRDYNGNTVGEASILD